MDELFSIRLVIADFYMEKPIRGFDPCYSEFRGKEIKRVPIIRIFGANGNGQKTCMHVHGVFPYFYIPYEKKDFETLNKAIYQIATNVDKAINISLGQGSSETQHVFKIHPVKGIPFYGYHRSEHQFLKIYMFNPRFVRRAANLLQNGAILGKNFHPHESHVPYILQFMIDYNLYGMSLLHVPLEIVKFRRSTEDQVIPFVALQLGQILNTTLAKKQTISALEVDIASNFILNRFQLLTKSSNVHSNPGIESIWNDEKLRRQNLKLAQEALAASAENANSNKIPPLEIPTTQERHDVRPADSEAFYRTALLGKLLTLETSLSGGVGESISDQTLNLTQQAASVTNSSLTALSNASSKEQRRTFNLKKLLANAVYPEECAQDERLTNASFIENHLPSNSMFEATLSRVGLSGLRREETAFNTLAQSEDIFLDDTLVDEEFVLSLTQQAHVPLNASLREEDMELLDVLQQLETENANENPIDLDSSLAPLSQQRKHYDPSPELLDKQAAAAVVNLVASSDSDSNDEDGTAGHAHDFSIVMDDIDELLLKLTQSQPKTSIARPRIPQIDGSDDMLRTPTKPKPIQGRRNTTTVATGTKQAPHTPPRTPKHAGRTASASKTSPARSPRTPKAKAALKYAPLPLVITNSSGKRNLNHLMEETSPTRGNNRSNLHGDRNTEIRSRLTLRKTLALTEMRRKSISSASELQNVVIQSQEPPASTSRTSLRRSRSRIDLDKTHITCSLTPRRTSERLLRVYNPAQEAELALPEETAENAQARPASEQNAKRKAQPSEKVAGKTVSKEVDIQSEATEKDASNERDRGCKMLKVKVKRLQPQRNLNSVNNSASSARTTRSKRLQTETFPEITAKNSAKPKKSPSNEPGTKRMKNQNVENQETPARGIQTRRKANETKQSVVATTEALERSANVERTDRSPRKSTHVEEPPEEAEKANRRAKKRTDERPANTKANDVANKSDPNINTLTTRSSSLKGYEQLDASHNNEEDETKSDALRSGDQMKGSSTSMCVEHLSKPTDNDANTSDDDEEIAASDVEENAEKSLPQLRKTPNLKRLSEHLRRRTPSTILEPSAVLRSRSSSKSARGAEECGGVLDEPITPKRQHLVKNNVDVEECEQFADEEEDDDLKIRSFYDQSLLFDSPSLFSAPSSPIFSPHLLQQLRQRSPSCAATVEPAAERSSAAPSPSAQLAPLSGSGSSAVDAVAVVTPLDLPPTRSEVLASCRKFEIAEYEFTQPHYSNPDDVTKQKEVGYLVLQIAGNKLNDCAEFESVLGAEARGLAQWRRRKLAAIGGIELLTRYRSAALMREFCATQQRVAIEPHWSAPSRQEARLWAKARELVRGEQPAARVADTEDSPIKVRRQKVTLMLNEDGTGDNGGGDEDADCSTRSISLTPLTPLSVIDRHRSQRSRSRLSGAERTTPLSSTSAAGESVKRSVRRAKLSLQRKLETAMDADLAPSTSGGSTVQSQESESIASELALAALERPSFVQQLHSNSGEMQHDCSFGLSTATLNNTYGFKVNLENLQQAKSDIECNYLTTIVLELFVPTRGDLHPNPALDGIRCIFYAIEHSLPTSGAEDLARQACGYIIVNDSEADIVREHRIHGIDADVELQVVANEQEALEALLVLCARWDPDIYAGYEIEMASWGYVIERSKYLCINIGPLLSRVPTQKMHDFVDEDREQFTDLDIEMKLCGRILLDVWRLMRSEIALTSYSFENLMYHILHKRCPHHDYRQLSEWFGSPCSRWIVIEYYLERVRGTLALLDQLDLLGRTSEMAKLIGIQFYEVLSRGSQFRVESMMLRIAKPKNLVPLSPSVQQRAHMRAPEYLALIMEPQSRFYADPVIVLDFQSLYPSMIIAYNYCFSTCLGRVEHLGQSSPFEFGASQLRVSPTLLRKLVERDLVNISPCGIVFVKAIVREGILPRMLTEILDTRQMVKQSMKLHKGTALQRILHSRQLGLKLMANVTYGYTAANFSGRMPAVEVGDSVVAKGRETLERAIKLVEANDKWNVRVVYGDTDSMFVLVPGRNRAKAFQIGEEIAAAVTQMYPHPVKLKLEKVYQPCILQTKKRYVGYMYETADQAEPVYEAKGIETVRRDGCPAVAKMLEKVLRILFESADVSQVKQYVCRQFTKLLSGRANVQDLIFAKEFRGINGYKPTACVPALELTRKWILSDPRRIPRRGERVPFIITNGPPGVSLIRLVRSPHEVLSNEGLKINAIYYITKAIIPPLNRCLLLIGADVNEWFANLPRKLLLTPAFSTGNELMAAPNSKANALKKSIISQYFSTSCCLIDCGRQTKCGICDVCATNSQKAVVTLQAKAARIERGYHLTQQMCQACSGRVGAAHCSSLDCPVLYVLEVKRRDLQQVQHFRKLLDDRFGMF